MGSCTFSFSGYFQKERLFPSRTNHLLCQAPNPDTSSNIVRNPLLVTWLSLWQLSLKLTEPSRGDILGTLSNLQSFLAKLEMVIRALPTIAKLEVLTVCGPPGEETLGLLSLDSVLEIFNLGVKLKVLFPFFMWYLASWGKDSLLVWRPYTSSWMVKSLFRSLKLMRLGKFR